MSLFDQALNALQNGRPAEAEILYRQIIAQDPTNFDALHMLGIVCSENEKPTEAEQFFLAALSIDQRFPPCFHNYGLHCAKHRQFELAVAQFDKALSLSPEFAPVHSDRGCALAELGHLEEARKSHNKAVALAPNVPRALYNRALTFAKMRDYVSALRDFDEALGLNANYASASLGKGDVFIELKRYDEAFAAYDRALVLNPNSAEARLGRGNVFFELKRYDEALAAYDDALALRPNLAEAWLGRGNLLTEIKRYDEALAAYDRTLTLKPDSAEAWLGRGNLFAALKRYSEAFAAYDKALALKSDLAGAWLGRGSVLNELKRYDEAFAAYDRTLILKPDSAEACLGRGNLFAALKRHGEAFAAYDKALVLKPDLEFVEGARLHAKMHLCDWSDLEGQVARLVDKIERGEKASGPLPILAISSSIALQRNAAEIWVAAKHPPNNALAAIIKHPRRDKIQIGYFSADFREHPVSFLTAELFEGHDRSRFEVTALSFGPDTKDKMRLRLEAAFDKFIDVGNKSDRDIALTARTLGIDIAVDLGGFTADSRTNIFAMRAAPLQVNYLGYPATMGARYIDYIIADRFVIPEAAASSYSEKIVYLPDAFQAQDSKRSITIHPPSRSGAGLPESGFVFCNFNNNYKITPAVFDIWMRLVQQIEGSVLWLLAEDAAVELNLFREAKNRGVDPSRLVFAPRVAYSDYLARYRLGDLFLDSFPFNAGATASDALWAGLPVLTCSGEAFASRMAGSLLTATGLTELIATTPQAYEALAIELATHPTKLRDIKRKLSESRVTAPLCDTQLFVKNIEAAYTAMYERDRAGQPPDHIHLPRELV